ncbi:hypothetical protein LJR260_001618 [Variovorax paradoxus]|uniref:JmjC domain-containing protein n=1 Tax=Variovorax paradoxus TaxID=34073 RepID=UPI003ED079C7
MTELEALLHPISLDRFQNEYFERSSLFIRCEDIAKASLVDTPMSGMVRATACAQPMRLRVNKAGSVVSPPRHFHSDRLERWAHNEYASGATLVLNYIEGLSSRSREFAARLGKCLDARITFTLFATPGHSQGFSPHFDTLDVFVLQTEGSKSWCVGPSALKLPTLRQGYLVDEKFGELPHQQFLLSPGDVLYIPRGTVHWATTSDQHSVHVTMDIDTATHLDLLKAALGSFHQNAEWGRRHRLALIDDPWEKVRSLLECLNDKDDQQRLLDLARREKWERER